MRKSGFARECARDAWARSARLLWKWPETAYTGISSLIAAIVVAANQDSPMNSLSDWLYAGLAGLIFPVSVLLFNLMMAPRRLWARDRKTISDLRGLLKARTTNLGLARRLENQHAEGQGLVAQIEASGTGKDRQFPSSWFSQHSKWFEDTLAIVSEAGNDERFLFDSIEAPPALPDSDCNPYDELRKLKARLNKLRMIAARYYGKLEDTD